jgi:hypothetical protein
MAATPRDGTTFLQILRNERKDVRWEASSVVVGDIDGDEKQDTVAVGYLPEEVVLAIHATTATSKINFLNFGVNPGAENAVCSVPVELSVMPLSCSSDTGRLPGCKETPKALALVLSDGDCDPINLYWSHDEHRLAWWRN